MSFVVGELVSILRADDSQFVAVTERSERRWRELSRVLGNAPAVRFIEPTVADEFDRARQRAERAGRAARRAGEEAAGGWRRLDAVLAGIAGGATVKALDMAGQAWGRLVRSIEQGIGRGIQFDASMESIEARIQGITKDAAATNRVLDIARERANALRMPYQEIAQAAAEILPMTRAYNQDLETALELTQLLVAASPEQGVSGARLALTELLAGDDATAFRSLAQRFELPRQRLRELTEEFGKLEGVRRVLQELGYDAEFLAAQTDTATRTWAVFQARINELSGTVVRRAFEDGADALNGFLAKLISRV